MSSFPRRGGGFSRPRRDNQQNEDPYGEAALDSFIPEQRRRVKDPQCTRLHVSNIPPTMSEVTLRQLFSDYGNPTIFLSNNVHPSTNKCWGFVDYDTYFEAQNAIVALNRTSPHNLYIKFANNAEENSETDDFRREIQKPRDEEPLSIRGRGRGAHVPLTGRAPSSLRAKKQSFEDYSNEPEGDYAGAYSSSRFRHDDTPSHIRDTNQVYDSVSRITRGMKSVSLGRGTYINDNVEQYKYPQVSTKVEQKLEDHLLNKVLKPTKEDVRCYPPNVDKLPFETGRCPCCDKPSAYICCNCKKWYCSTDCVREHVAKCGTGCTRSTIRFETKCSSNHDVEDGYMDKKHEVQESNQRSRNDNYRQSPRNDDINNRMKINQQRGNNKKENNKSGRASFSSEEGYPKRNGGNNNNGRNRNSRNSGTRGFFTDVEDDNGSVSQMKTNNHNRNSRGGDRRSGGGGGSDLGGRHRRSKSQSRNSFDNRNNHDNEVYIRKDDANTSAPLLQRTVLVTSVTESNEVYWVCKKTSLLDQMDLIKSLENLKSKTVTSPTVNATFAAPFGKEWYRAKVLSISGYNVKVLFIDYGNETTVAIDELKVLPLELISKPPLAFKIRIVGCPRKLKEDEEIVIILKSKDSSGAWHAKLVDNSSPRDDDNKKVGEKVPVKCNEEEPSPISFDHFNLVHIMDGQNGEYYVQLEHNVLKLVSMGEQLGKFESTKVEPKLGELYVRNYSGTWCRAEVIKERPLTVFYIDYGNEEVVDKSDLHPVPKQFKDIPGLAVKIKLADGTSKEYYNLKMPESLSVKAVDTLEDGTLLVQVKGEKYDRVTKNGNDAYPKGVYSDKEREAKHVLELVKTGEAGIWVCIQKALSVECLSGFIIINTKSPDYCSTSDLSELLKSVEPAHKFEPKVGDLVIARVGMTFCRGYVMLKTKEDISVALIDFGKVFSVKEKNLTLLPTRFHKYPLRQAVRVILKTPLTADNYRTELVGNKVHLKNVQKVGNLIKCTFGDYKEAEVIPWTPLVEEAGLRVFPVNNNSPVTIASYHSPKSVYVNPASKESTIKFAELVQDLSLYIPRAVRFNRQPLCGELVCAKYREDGKYYRAQIYEKAEDDSFKINFVDFGNTEVVSVDDMLPLPDEFKKIPCFAVKVGLKDIAGHNFNAQAVAYLNRLSMSENTLLLMYDDNLGEVMLSQQDGRVINNDLRDLMEPSLVSLEMPSSEHVKKLHPFMGTDVIYESWEVNSRINIAIAAAESHRTVLAIQENTSLLRHLVEFLVPKTTEYCRKAAQKSYNPRANEVILAKYIDDDDKDDVKKEGKWYRAICIKPMISSALVLFIDYGNCGELKHSDIRSMPAEFMDTPATLKRCSIYGILDDISADVKQKIKNFYINWATTAIVLEDNEDGNSILWIPSLYPKLEDLGHPPVDPPPGV